MYSRICHETVTSIGPPGPPGPPPPPFPGASGGPPRALRGPYTNKPAAGVVGNTPASRDALRATGFPAPVALCNSCRSPDAGALRDARLRTTKRKHTKSPEGKRYRAPRYQVPVPGSYCNSPQGSRGTLLLSGHLLPVGG